MLIGEPVEHVDGRSEFEERISEPLELLVAQACISSAAASKFPLHNRGSTETDRGVSSQDELGKDRRGAWWVVEGASIVERS